MPSAVSGRAINQQRPVASLTTRKPTRQRPCCLTNNDQLPCSLTASKTCQRQSESNPPLRSFRRCRSSLLEAFHRTVTLSRLYDTSSSTPYGHFESIAEVTLGTRREAAEPKAAPSNRQPGPRSSRPPVAFRWSVRERSRRHSFGTSKGTAVVGTVRVP